jgi:hypothetical protein
VRWSAPPSTTSVPSLRALPVCSFVQAFLQRHAEYADLDYRAPRSIVAD